MHGADHTQKPLPCLLKSLQYVELLYAVMTKEHSPRAESDFMSSREHAPSIIFMDEVDSIGSARLESGSSGGDSEVQRTMLELLNQLDGFEATNKIKACI